MEKQDLRREIARLRDALEPELRLRYSEIIHNTLTNNPEYQAVRTIAYFLSFRSEVKTMELIEAGLASGKRVLLPVTDLDNKRLIFSELRNIKEELARSTYGILEPKTEFIRPVAYEEIELVITPGLVFDQSGYRVGYGGGFYDRFLGEVIPRPLTIALAFDLQVLNEPLPHEQFDIPVDLIVTEKRIILCRENREKGRV